MFTGTSVPQLRSHIWVGQPAEVRGEVEPQALSSPWERHPTDEDDEEQQIGKRGGEVDHLETNNKLKKKQNRLFSSLQQHGLKLALSLIM